MKNLKFGGWIFYKSSSNTELDHNSSKVLKRRLSITPRPRHTVSVLLEEDR